MIILIIGLNRRKQPVLCAVIFAQKKPQVFNCCKNMRIYLSKTLPQLSYQIKHFITANIIYNLLKIENEKRIK